MSDNNKNINDAKEFLENIKKQKGLASFLEETADNLLFKINKLLKKNRKISPNEERDIMSVYNDIVQKQNKYLEEKKEKLRLIGYLERLASGLAGHLTEATTRLYAEVINEIKRGIFNKIKYDNLVIVLKDERKKIEAEEKRIKGRNDINNILSEILDMENIQEELRNKVSDLRDIFIKDDRLPPGELKEILEIYKRLKKADVSVEEDGTMIERKVKTTNAEEMEIDGKDPTENFLKLAKKNRRKKGDPTFSFGNPVTLDKTVRNLTSFDLPNSGNIELINFKQDIVLGIKQTRYKNYLGTIQNQQGSVFDIYGKNDEVNDFLSSLNGDKIFEKFMTEEMGDSSLFFVKEAIKKRSQGRAVFRPGDLVNFKENDEKPKEKQVKKPPAKIGKKEARALAEIRERNKKILKNDIEKAREEGKTEEEIQELIDERTEKEEEEEEVIITEEKKVEEKKEEVTSDSTLSITTKDDLDGLDILSDITTIPDIFKDFDDLYANSEFASSDNIKNLRILFNKFCKTKEGIMINTRNKRENITDGELVDTNMKTAVDCFLFIMISLVVWKEIEMDMEPKNGEQQANYRYKTDIKNFFEKSWFYYSKKVLAINFEKKALNYKNLFSGEIKGYRTNDNYTDTPIDNFRKKLQLFADKEFFPERRDSFITNLNYSSDRKANDYWSYVLLLDQLQLECKKRKILFGELDNIHKLVFSRLLNWDSDIYYDSLKNICKSRGLNYIPIKNIFIEIIENSKGVPTISECQLLLKRAKEENFSEETIIEIHEETISDMRKKQNSKFKIYIPGSQQFDINLETEVSVYYDEEVENSLGISKKYYDEVILEEKKAEKENKKKNKNKKRRVQGIARDSSSDDDSSSSSSSSSSDDDSFEWQVEKTEKVEINLKFENCNVGSSGKPKLHFSMKNLTDEKIEQRFDLTLDFYVPHNEIITLVKRSLNLNGTEEKLGESYNCYRLILKGLRDWYKNKEGKMKEIYDTYMDPQTMSNQLGGMSQILPTLFLKFKNSFTAEQIFKDNINIHVQLIDCFFEIFYSKLENNNNEKRKAISVIHLLMKKNYKKYIKDIEKIYENALGDKNQDDISFDEKEDAKEEELIEYSEEIATKPLREKRIEFSKTNQKKTIPGGKKINIHGLLDNSQELTLEIFDICGDEEIDKNIEEKISSLKKEIKDLESGLNTEYSKLSSTIKDYEEKISNYKKNLSALHNIPSDRKEIIDTILSGIGSYIELNSFINIFDDEIKNIEKKIKESVKKLESRNELINDIQRKRDMFSIKERISKVPGFSLYIQDIERKKISLASQIIRLEKKNESISTEIEKLKTTGKEKDRIGTLEKTVNQNKKEIEDLEKNILFYKDDEKNILFFSQKTMGREIEYIKFDIEESSVQIDIARKTINRLESILEMENKMEKTTEILSFYSEYYSKKLEEKIEERKNINAQYQEEKFSLNYYDESGEFDVKEKISRKRAEISRLESMSTEKNPYNINQKLDYDGFRPVKNRKIEEMEKIEEKDVIPIVKTFFLNISRIKEYLYRKISEIKTEINESLQGLNFDIYRSYPLKNIVVINSEKIAFTKKKATISSRARNSYEALFGLNIIDEKNIKIGRHDDNEGQKELFGAKTGSLGLYPHQINLCELFYFSLNTGINLFLNMKANLGSGKTAAINALAKIIHLYNAKIKKNITNKEEKPMLIVATNNRKPMREFVDNFLKLGFNNTMGCYRILGKNNRDDSIAFFGRSPGIEITKELSSMGVFVEEGILHDRRGTYGLAREAIDNADILICHPQNAQEFIAMKEIRERAEKRIGRRVFMVLDEIDTGGVFNSNLEHCLGSLFCYPGISTFIVLSASLDDQSGSVKFIMGQQEKNKIYNNKKHDFFAQEYAEDPSKYKDFEGKFYMEEKGRIPVVISAKVSLVPCELRQIDEKPIDPYLGYKHEEIINLVNSDETFRRYISWINIQQIKEFSKNKDIRNKFGKSAEYLNFCNDCDNYYSKATENSIYDPAIFYLNLPPEFHRKLRKYSGTMNEKRYNKTEEQFDNEVPKSITGKEYLFEINKLKNRELEAKKLATKFIDSFYDGKYSRSSMMSKLNKNLVQEFIIVVRKNIGDSHDNKSKIMNSKFSSAKRYMNRIFFGKADDYIKMDNDNNPLIQNEKIEKEVERMVTGFYEHYLYQNDYSSSMQRQKTLRNYIKLFFDNETDGEYVMGIFNEMVLLYRKYSDIKTYYEHEISIARYLLEKWNKELFDGKKIVDPDDKFDTYSFLRVYEELKKLSFYDKNHEIYEKLVKNNLEAEKPIINIERFENCRKFADEFLSSGDFYNSVFEKFEQIIDENKKIVDNKYYTLVATDEPDKKYNQVYGELTGNISMVIDLFSNSRDYRDMIKIEFKEDLDEKDIYGILEIKEKATEDKKEEETTENVRNEEDTKERTQRVKNVTKIYEKGEKIDDSGYSSEMRIQGRMNVDIHGEKAVKTFVKKEFNPFFDDLLDALYKEKNNVSERWFSYKNSTRASDGEFSTISGIEGRVNEMEKAIKSTGSITDYIDYIKKYKKLEERGIYGSILDSKHVNFNYEQLKKYIPKYLKRIGAKSGVKESDFNIVKRKFYDIIGNMVRNYGFSFPYGIFETGYAKPQNFRFFIEKNQQYVYSDNFDSPISEMLKIFTTTTSDILPRERTKYNICFGNSNLATQITRPFESVLVTENYQHNNIQSIIQICGRCGRPGPDGSTTSVVYMSLECYEKISYDRKDNSVDYLAYRNKFYLQNTDQKVIDEELEQSPNERRITKLYTNIYERAERRPF